MKLSIFNNLSQDKKQSILNQHSKFIKLHYWVTFGVMGIIIIVLILLMALPHYNALKTSWWSTKYNQIKIRESETIKTVSENFGGIENYIQYLQVDAMKNGDCEIIYKIEND